MSALKENPDLFQPCTRNYLFFKPECCEAKSCLTQPAPDDWDSARLLEFVLNFGRFPFPSLFLPTSR